ncbi:molybdopterin-dependent oxidoreductase [Chloroflexota bacterium]
MKKIIRTVCQGCHPECGVLVQVEDGKVTKIAGDPDHPFSRGAICQKGRYYHQFTYHPDRVKYPLKRSGDKGEGKWEAISWEQALTEMAEKVTEIRDKYGPLANGIIHGTGPRSSGPASRLLANLLGSPNRVSVDLHICMVPTLLSDVITVGEGITMEKGPDYLSSKCILVCGANPLAAHLPRGMDILEAKRKHHAKLIVIDPRLTLLASKADIWLQVRPGTDGALILSFINVIVKENLYDKEFVEKWCSGFEKLVERVREYTPEKAAAITWVPAEKIREAARMYATTKPASLHQRVAINQNINSTQTSRAIVTLVALTGNVDVPGGNLLQTPIKGCIPDCPFDLERGIIEKRIGSQEYPLISGPEAPFDFVHGGLGIEAILTGKPYPLKGLFCWGGNPVMVMPDSKRVWEALKKLELFVVIDYFITPTAEVADYILPSATWLERDEICREPYNNLIAARQKAIEPLFDCWDDAKIVLELSRKLPWADRKFIPWNSIDERNDYRVKGMGMTFNELKEKGYLVKPAEYRKYEKSGFRTPTGKVELYSTTFEKHGYDPLPNYVEPPESPLSSPEIMEEYPFILISGGRCIEYYNSQGHQIPSLRKRVPYPEIEIHPDAAKKEKLKNGDWIWVETPKVKGERVKLKVKITSSIDPRVVHAAHGWWYPEKQPPEHGCFESNINVVLTDDPPREPICGSVPLRGTLCRIYK